MWSAVGLVIKTQLSGLKVSWAKGGGKSMVSTESTECFRVCMHVCVSADCLGWAHRYCTIVGASAPNKKPRHCQYIPQPRPTSLPSLSQINYAWQFLDNRPHRWNPSLEVSHFYFYIFIYFPSNSISTFGCFAGLCVPGRISHWERPWISMWKAPSQNIILQPKL